MPLVKLIDPAEDPRWDPFVEKHPFGWICHLSGWKKFLEQNFPHMKGFYFARMDDAGEKIQAALPVYYVKSWLTGNRLVSIPFATLCDPLISTKSHFDELSAEVIKLSEKLRCKKIEIRTLYSSDLSQQRHFNVDLSYKHHYINMDRDLNEIKKSFHRKTTRQSINRALKNNIVLKIGKDKSDLKEFYKFYILTRRHIGLPPIPYHFFNNLFDIFSFNKICNLFLAKYKKNIIAALIFFKYKDRISLEYAGWNREYAKLCPNHFLYWEAIKLAHEAGYKFFDFGRTSSSNLELMKFKQRWGTKEVDFKYYYYPKDIIDHVTHIENSWKYRLVQNACKISPVLFQQIIGKICYRHLG